MDNKKITIDYIKKVVKIRTRTLPVVHYQSSHPSTLRTFVTICRALVQWKAEIGSSGSSPLATGKWHTLLINRIKFNISAGQKEFINNHVQLQGI